MTVRHGVVHVLSSSVHCSEMLHCGDVNGEIIHSGRGSMVIFSSSFFSLQIFNCIEIFRARYHKPISST